LLSHGLTGFGYAMLCSTVAAMTVRLVYLAKLFPARSIAVHVARSFLPTLPAAAVILLEREVLGFDDSVTRLVLEVAAYGVLVLATTWVTERSLLREAVGYLRQRARTSEAQTEPPTRLA
ncbi:MAG: hypothetical protein QOJ67_2370, partial [Acidimicrobiaceae bacterium]